MGVLHRQRLIEAELLADRLDLGRRGVGPRNRNREIPGKVQQKEGDNRHRYRDGYCDDKPL